MQRSVFLNNSKMISQKVFNRINASKRRVVLQLKPFSTESQELQSERETFIKNVLNNLNMQSKANAMPKRIVIDFSSPNIAKPFHVGHLRSTIIGNFIANINRHFSNSVTTINYLGDWGTQFGLLQCGLKDKNIKIDDLKEEPIKTLYSAYVHANKLAAGEEFRNNAKKLFSDIEQGKADLGDWKKIRDITVQELEKVYKRLGITFDEYHWESDYNGESIKDIISLLESKKIIREDESGKKVARVRDRNVAVLKSDNTTLYLSRDIASLLDKYKRYNFDEMLYVVDMSQQDHFTALFDIVGRINKDCADSCKHIKFGRLHGMSTRAGNVVFLNDILDEAKQKMYEKQKASKNTRSAAMDETTCDILGTTAVIINDLKQRRVRDYMFEWDKALQSEGDSGIKLQYLHCRLWSLEKNSGAQIPDYCDPKYLPEPVVDEVIIELSKFEDVLQRAKDQNEACLIVNYLFKLAKHVNRMFNELKVKGETPDVASQRLLVFHSARLVVKKSLQLLGATPLNEM